jgi:hypothetical protein
MERTSSRKEAVLLEDGLPERVDEMLSERVP